jgi:hypothetical protein
MFAEHLERVPPVFLGASQVSWGNAKIIRQGMPRNLGPAEWDDLTHARAFYVRRLFWGG